MAAAEGAPSGDPLATASELLAAHAALPKCAAEQLMQAVWVLPYDAPQPAVRSLLADAERCLADPTSGSNEMLNVAVADLRQRLQRAARSGDRGAPECDESGSDDGTGWGSGSDPSAASPRRSPEAAGSPPAAPAEQHPAQPAAAPAAAASGAADAAPPASFARPPALHRDPAELPAGGEGAVVRVDVKGSRMLTEMADGSAVLWDTATGERLRNVEGSTVIDRVQKATGILADQHFPMLPVALRAAAQRVFNELSAQEMLDNAATVRLLAGALRQRIGEGAHR
eukprot:TRINITY_DN6580_c6_g1_i2.p1 TRINITY_DN6580_c6_g1~~TRINITY_DN6580_c6_g1_i2.p1  ORF type:complete len:309 (+),score=94.96 TRINITY_DN6580_c6_g1_i2:78-929(+)